MFYSPSSSAGLSALFAEGLLFCRVARLDGDCCKKNAE